MSNKLEIKTQTETLVDNKSSRRTWRVPTLRLLSSDGTASSGVYAPKEGEGSIDGAKYSFRFTTTSKGGS